MKTQEEYKESGGDCPNCGEPSQNHYYHNVDICFAGAFQQIDCGNCETRWFDVYDFIKYEIREV